MHARPSFVPCSPLKPAADPPNKQWNVANTSNLKSSVKKRARPRTDRQRRDSTGRDETRRGTGRTSRLSLLPVGTVRAIPYLLYLLYLLTCLLTYLPTRRHQSRTIPYLSRPNQTERTRISHHSVVPSHYSSRKQGAGSRKKETGKTGKTATTETASSGRTKKR
ncbi:uncharacterized protein IWZ02DRAFT_141356 [Phyllosticta citriasiana]|uniref:uncharacterized protein n=1 Tax=Phyllosticta citriasiana TaxID=595635 RepID=UPI0030FD2A7E